MRRRYEDIPGHPDQLAAEAERRANTIDEFEEGPRVGAVQCTLSFLLDTSGLKQLKERLGMDVELVVQHELNGTYLVVGTAPGFEPLADSEAQVPFYSVEFTSLSASDPVPKTRIKQEGFWRPLSEVHPNTLYTSRVDLDALAAWRNEGQIEP